MVRIIHREIEVDRCNRCKGLWFDAMEKEELLEIDGAEVVDSGSAARGRRYDQLRNVKCPRCNVRMTTMVDEQQSHIHYEACPQCSGTFFDAGEFRDLKEFTVIERIVAMLKSKRDRRSNSAGNGTDSAAGLTRRDQPPAIGIFNENRVLSVR
jgi:Zn-finger nucleic acid-binding protein